MNWEHVCTLADIVAALSVLASAIYLAGQIRQSNRRAFVDFDRKAREVMHVRWFGTEWAHADSATTNKLLNEAPTQDVIYDVRARLSGQISAVRREVIKQSQE